MKLSFRNERDKVFYTSEKALTISYGKRMAAKIIQRLGELQAADNPQHLPRNARFHQHSGPRKGLFSVDLVHPFRMIVLPTCEYESWVEITSVEVCEIMDPH